MFEGPEKKFQRDIAKFLMRDYTLLGLEVAGEQ